MKTVNEILGVALLTVLVSVSAQADILYSANYGDFVGDTVTYLEVTESSETDANALYNAPSISLDTITFNPDFTSFSEGAGGSDTTDGKLTFEIDAHSGSVVNELKFSEAGDVNLIGFSGDAYADVSANFIVTVTEVDGIAINPVTGTTAMTFSPSADGSFLLSNLGGPGYNSGWTGLMEINVDGLLTSENVPFVSGATKLTVTLDNTLSTLSQAGTEAFIAKKDFKGFSVTSVAIPEPASAVLLVGMTSGLMFVRRRLIS
jgi:hypothetical protein